MFGYSLYSYPFKNDLVRKEFLKTDPKTLAYLKRLKTNNRSFMHWAMIYNLANFEFFTPKEMTNVSQIFLDNVQRK